MCLYIKEIMMNEQIAALINNIEKVIIGKRESVVTVIAALLCDGHVLIEDVPGVGKTRLAAAIARSVNGTFNRLQLTPDVMPQDITGFTMLNTDTRKFEFRQGAAVCNFLLADEINRASPKVQSGLLEIMDERQISVDGNTYPIPKPFMTLATQNPVETYGTYHLPEAQMDRFLVRISLGYLRLEEEMALLDPAYHENKNIQSVLTAEDVVRLQGIAQEVFCHESVREYILRIVNATRDDKEHIKLGISPRGAMGLYAMAKAAAFIKGRDFVTPGDVCDNAVCVLAHRLILSPKGKGRYHTQAAAIEDIVGNTVQPLSGVDFGG
jgi:MoxR-like ATPase